jgi:MFS family permease
VADWSALYLRQVVGAEAGAAGLGYTAYALLMAAGRFGGDWVRTLWGPVVVARVCYGIAVLGLILVVTAANYPLVLVGFALAGFGGSVGVPLAVSAAASVGGRPPAANVAMVSLVSLVGFLCAPPVLGALAQIFGLRAAFSVFLLPVLAVAIFVAYTLAPSRSAGARRALAE